MGATHVNADVFCFFFPLYEAAKVADICGSARDSLKLSPHSFLRSYHVSSAAASATGAHRGPALCYFNAATTRRSTQP